MDENAFLSNLRALRQRLETELPNVLLATVVDTTSQIRNRSIENGIFVDAIEGAKATYSTNEIPTFFFKAKVKNQGGRDYLKNNPLGTWHDFKQAQGMPGQYVNLSYTGRFWANLGPGPLIQLGRVYSFEVSVSDGEVLKYADYLVDNYGEFYQPTQAEEKESREVMKDQLERFVKQYV